ncbi:hypothetical protein VNO77_44057 [Canavalia gladiata]|uniref:Uncharacterized protein n=1 Tax=Canavalia gladiata TaxID=3824 RepID=A0AAN9JXV2_CANGL
MKKMQQLDVFLNIENDGKRWNNLNCVSRRVVTSYDKERHNHGQQDFLHLSATPTNFNKMRLSVPVVSLQCAPHADPM